MKRPKPTKKWNCQVKFYANRLFGSGLIHDETSLSLTEEEIKFLQTHDIAKVTKMRETP